MALPLLAILGRAALAAGRGSVAAAEALGGRKLLGAYAKQAGKGASAGDDQAEAFQLALMFRRYLRIAFRENFLRLKAKSPFTMLVQKQTHNNPLLNTGALIQKYVVVDVLTKGCRVGFDTKAIYTDGPPGMRIPVGDLLTLLEGGAVIASKADDPEKFKAVSRWMAMVLQKAGFPRIKGRKRVYRIPARPFFTRVANRFIRDHKDPARVFRVDRWKLYIYVNREDNSDAPIKVAKPGAQG